MKLKAQDTRLGGLGAQTQEHKYQWLTNPCTLQRFISEAVRIGTCRGGYVPRRPLDVHPSTLPLILMKQTPNSKSIRSRRGIQAVSRNTCLKKFSAFRTIVWEDNVKAVHRMPSHVNCSLSVNGINIYHLRSKIGLPITVSPSYARVLAN